MGYIMVVDDIAFMRRLLSGIIRGLGYEVKEAAGGKEAVLMMTASPPDLAFVDLAMPDVGGLQLCQWIRSNNNTRDIPIIVCTAHQARKDVEDALRAGADDFLCKPVDRRTVANRLAKYLIEE